MTQSQALSILKTGVNVFLTGEPGSGKTHLINQYVAYLRACGIEPTITASTGIAATHINGMTIHSWSGIGIKTKLDKRDLNKIVLNKFIEKRVGRAKVLIIDEVSMLSPETFSMVDTVCREIKKNPEPFGGMQVILVGDFFQLPPIVKEKESEDNGQTEFLKQPLAFFAYDSFAWTRLNPIVCYLTEQYRQDDNNFLAILSSIRRGVFDNNHLRYIETRKIEYRFAPADAPKLFSHNVDVDRVNNEMLAKLPGKPQTFAMSSQGSSVFVAALKRGCLSPETLSLKIGAAVMFTKNNPKEGFVNGTLGTVIGNEAISGGTGYPIVKTRNNRRIVVKSMDWTIEEDGMTRAKITQLPLRLAWAITVHKSQGMSLEAAVIDLSVVFEFGQGYVALSRVRRLSGLHLLGWNKLAFQVHPEILSKDESFRAASSKAEITFSKISSAELAKMHKDFITAGGGKLKFTNMGNSYLRENKREKSNTYGETLILWNEGKDILQIAKMRGLKEQTVFNHVENLIEKGKINRAELSRLLTPSLSRALPKIHATFRELDTYKLSPVFKKFGGAYSYNELRIARIILNG